MELDLNLLRSGVTVLSFLAFAAIVVWATSRGNRQRFDEAAQLPLLETQPPAAPSPSAPRAASGDPL